MSYVVRGLDPKPYSHLFGLSDAELAERGVVRMTVSSPSFPCRVSLTDREIGEKVLLLNHGKRSYRLRARKCRHPGRCRRADRQCGRCKNHR